MKTALLALVMVVCAVGGWATSRSFGVGPQAYFLRQTVIHSCLELSAVLTILGFFAEAANRKSTRENGWHLLAMIGFAATVGLTLGTPALYR